MNLREKIQIQKKAEQSGPFQPLDEYEDYKTLWAEARFLRGKNLYAAKAANVKTDVEFIVRYCEGLDETMRVVHNGRNYEIEGITPMDNNKSYMMIRAYEIKHDV